MTLPKGRKTLFDEAIIDSLCRDQEFKKSVEETYGKILDIYPDWENNYLVYDLSNGRVLCSDLDQVLMAMR